MNIWALLGVTLGIGVLLPGVIFLGLGYGTAASVRMMKVDFYPSIVSKRLKSETELQKITVLLLTFSLLGRRVCEKSRLFSLQRNRIYFISTSLLF
jgi:hypothetical protein